MNKRNTAGWGLTTSDKIYLIPIILLLGYIPLIMRYAEYDIGLSVAPWGYESTEYDFYLIWKMRSILIVSAVMLVLLVMKLRKEKLSLRRIPIEFTILTAYSVLVFLSGVFSPWRKYAFTGSFEMFRTVPVVMAYVLMYIYTYFTVKTKGQLLFIAKWTMPGIFVMGLIGTLQTFGFSIYDMRIIRLLMLPTDMWEYAGDMSIEEGVYATLFNPDYLAQYAALVLPVTVVSAIVMRDIKWRIFSAVTSLLLMISLVGTDTATVYISLVFALIFVALILCSRSRRLLKIFLTSAGAGTVAVLLAIFLIPAVYKRADTILFGTANYREEIKDLDIDTLDDEIRIIYPNDLEAHFCYDAKDETGIDISVTDENGAQIPLIPYERADYDGYDVYADFINEGFMLDDKDYELTIVTASADEEYGCLLRLLIAGREYAFTKEEDGGYFYVTPIKHEAIKITKPEKSNMFADSFISGRGWIWNYSLPMLKNSMLLGGGSNAFLYEFPHNWAHYGDDTEFAAKPHNMYLQQWIENGFAAFILLLIFFMLYLIKTVKYLRLPDAGKDDLIIAAGLLVAIISYMISGLVNDAMMFISPFFWIFTGIQFSLSRIRRMK